MAAAIPARLPSRAGVLLIKRWETFSPEVYLCPAGWWTIGWGSTRGLDGQRLTAAHPPIDEALGTVLLWRDVMIATRAVNRLVPAPLDPHQVDALVSFVYNLGSGNLEASTLRRKILRGDVAGAADEFRRWVYAGGRKLRGLVLRREAEAALFRGDVLQSMAA